MKIKISRRKNGKNKKISVVVPMYYEEEVVQEFYSRMKKVLENMEYSYEIIFVDDGSKDKTLFLLKYLEQDDKAIKIISFSRNFGHQAAVCAGLK